MTGFASASGGRDHQAWTWELRAVNGRGLDVRLRVPEGIDGLEAALRPLIGARVKRGNVTVSLRFRTASPATALRLDPGHLRAVLKTLGEIDAEARQAGLALAPTSAAEILAVRGVFEDNGDAGAGEDADLRAALLQDFEAVLADFDAAREREGAALCALLLGQVDRIAELTDAAAALAEQRRPEADAQFRAALARVTEGDAAHVDPARVAQELALLAVKADVTEEMDRLRTHCRAARDLLTTGSPVGRKLDFLAQEFNREANTLCSKSQNTGLTATGLELKSVIEQMREQVQNVE
ncbi:MAG: YicC/YloC family endoribonuclease [Pseudomonadota bacterium]